MKRLFAALILLILPLGARAQADLTTAILDQHILPGFEHLAQSAEELAQVAARDCEASSPALRAAYGAAFDAWIAVSHLRMGPAEVKDRAFALGFWPDSRGATPKALGRLIRSKDPIAGDVAEYAEVSIAARGFYALEFLLYDPGVGATGQATYRCTLIRTITGDISTMTADIVHDWNSGYAQAMRDPDPSGPYHTQDDVLQAMLKALSTGLQFTAETRLGRPMGSFDRPRPKRAEVWRSGRSARHVGLSLQALRDLALHLAAENDDLAGDLGQAFDRASSLLTELDDPVFAGVSTPQGRLKVEVLQQSIEGIRTLVRARLGPQLGVAAGFNSLDGD